MFGKPTAPQYVAAGMTRDWPDARGLWANDSKNFLVWINERDHARIISMQKGGNIAQTFMRYCKGVNLVCAFSSNLCSSLAYGDTYEASLYSQHRQYTSFLGLLILLTVQLVK